MTTETHRPESALDRARAAVPTLQANAQSVDQHASFPTESMAAVARAGLMGLLVPPAYGGLGANIVDLCAVAEELGAACLSTAMVWSMHCQQVATIVAGATPALADRLLPRLGTGAVYVASVTTERGGGDLFHVKSNLTVRDGRLGLKREAPIVTGGAVADGFLISMRSAPKAPPSSVSLVYADRDQLSLGIKDGWDPLGVRGMHSVSMTLQGLLPSDQLIGEAGEFRVLGPQTFVPVGIIAWTACWLGAAQAAFKAIVDLVRRPKSRKRFDVTSDLFAERLARIRIDLDVVSAHLGRIVEEYGHRLAQEDFGDPSFMIHVYNLKVHSAETLFRVADRLMQLGGMGLGYMRDSPLPLERVFRDLRSASLNNTDDRLLIYSGRLSLMDRSVSLP